MSSQLFNLSEQDLSALPNVSNFRVGIVLSEWNLPITEKLLEGCQQTLKRIGVSPDYITVKSVPGCFELIYGCSQLAKSGLYDVVIALGCVIKGDTPHFDYICSAVTQGVAALNTNGKEPVIFGVLTVNNEQQAWDRAGGALGNKGDEFAITAVKMAHYAWQLED